MLFSDEHIATIKNYDFYKKDRLDGMNDGLRTVKAWGDYTEKVPFVSIIVTTYKRPADLKLTLASIMRQKFQDYEIIVVDNECADIAEDTDTQKLIKELSNPKIVYFRNLDPMNARMDRGASLARGEWICFCHDDDMLSANHLETMTSIVKMHPEINYLSCALRVFYENDLDQITRNGFIANNRHDGYCREACLQEGVFFHQGNWLGGLIKRSLYAEMGGIPQISLGCGDNIMCSKFIYLYSGFYRTQVPLYFYRRYNNQISSNSDNWFNTLVSMYFFSRYALKKISDLPKLDYAQLCIATINKWIVSCEKIWGMTLDLKQIAMKCGICHIENDSETIERYFQIWREFERKCSAKKDRTSFDIYLDKIAEVPY